MSDLVCIDLEASGLHPRSYPVEIGWCSLDFATSGLLQIAPDTTWAPEDWDPNAEIIHGLTRDYLMQIGLLPAAAANHLNLVLSDNQLVSDAPHLDFRWLRQLYEVAGVKSAMPLLEQEPTGPTLPAWYRSKGEFDVAPLLARALEAAGATVDGLIIHDHQTNLTIELAGLKAHRALDDAISHAIAFAAVGLIGLRDNDLSISRAIIADKARAAKAAATDRWEEIVVAERGEVD